MKLTKEERAQRLAPVEREIRRIAYPAPRDPSIPLVIGNSPRAVNVFAMRVNAQAVAEELDDLRAQVKELEKESHEAQAESQRVLSLYNSLVDVIASECGEGFASEDFPEEVALETIRQRDEARLRSQRMGEALGELKERVLPDGRPCWCPGIGPVTQQSCEGGECCTLARAALSEDGT